MHKMRESKNVDENIKAIKKTAPVVLEIVGEF
jgi:hypothetical protein